MSSKLTAGDLQIISRIAVFRGLKAETVEQIIAPATAMMLRPHEWIARQGDPATAFFIIIDGWVKLYRSAPSGDDTVIEIMTKGESFSEGVAFTGNRYIATAEAVTEARVGRIPADHLVRCIRQSPDIALAMVASITQHLHYLVSRSSSSRRKAACSGWPSSSLRCRRRSRATARWRCPTTRS
jgi:CRP-like cAMP-binding protein